MVFWKAAALRYDLMRGCFFNIFFFAQQSWIRSKSDAAAKSTLKRVDLLDVHVC